jgi:hypothetical protein
MLAAIALGVMLTAWGAPQADARTSVLARARVTNLEAKALGGEGAKEDCCPEPCITYRHRGPKLCCDCCKPPVETVIKVKDPCTCCEIEIPICMPACCEGEPTVCWTTGIFCRDVAVYEWCCGFQVRVAFKKCGDLIVTTWGR